MSLLNALELDVFEMHQTKRLVQTYFSFDRERTVVGTYSVTCWAMPAELGWAPSKQWLSSRGAADAWSKAMGWGSAVASVWGLPHLNSHQGTCIYSNGLWLTSWPSHFHMGCLNSHHQMERAQWAVVMGILGILFMAVFWFTFGLVHRVQLENSLSWKHSSVFQGKISQSLHTAGQLKAPTPASASSSLTENRGHPSLLHSLSLGLWVIHNRSRTYINSKSWEIGGSTDLGWNSSFSVF